MQAILRCLPLSAALVAAAVSVGVAPASRADSEMKLSRGDVPAQVLAAFAKAYPSATPSRFAREEKGGKTFYEVESREGRVSRDLLFAPDGALVEVEERISPADLPSAVREAIDALGPKVTIRRAERVTRGGCVTYDVTLSGTAKRERTFDPTGRPVGE